MTWEPPFVRVRVKAARGNLGEGRASGEVAIEGPDLHGALVTSRAHCPVPSPPSAVAMPCARVRSSTRRVCGLFML